MHIFALKGHAIHLARAVVVVRPGVERQHLAQRLQLLLAELLCNLTGDVYLKLFPLAGVDKAAAGVGVGVTAAASVRPAAAQ